MRNPSTLAGHPIQLPPPLAGGSKGGCPHLKLWRSPFPTIAFCALFTLIIMGCESTPTELENYHPEPVLNAFLFYGEPLEEARLERVTSLYGDFLPGNHGIGGAGIRIYELGGADTLQLIEDPGERGRYIPETGDTLVPQAGARYRIEAATPAGEYLWAETTVPGAMEASGTVELFYTGADGWPHSVNEGDTLTRDYPNLNLGWSAVDSAGGYESVLLALTDRDSLAPLDPEWDPNDPDDEIEDINRWRAVELTYRYDQRWTMLQWFLFAWEGPYRIELRAISAEYYNYIYSLFRMEQGSLSEPVSNIQGGRGVFAGLSRWRREIYMKKVGG